MPNYQKGKVYKIVSRDPLIEDSYVGSTCNFTARRAMHKKTTTNRVHRLYHIPLYTFIRANGGWDNFDIILIEEYPCTSKLQLLARERHHFDLLKPSLNVNTPGRTTREYNSLPRRKEQARYKSKIYYNNNKQKVLDREKRRRIHKIKCNCGSSVIKAHYEKHKLSGLHKKKLAKDIKIHANWCKSIDEIESWFEDSLTNEFNEICAKIDAILITK